MKSFRFVLIIVLIIHVGCTKQEGPSPIIGQTQDKIIDSLNKVIGQKDVAYDSLRKDFKSWVIHTFDTENQCIVFAKAVKKSPSNSIFIEGWITRKFSWAHEWKKKKK
jgi:hypothetical protein